jgi:hypothetical protein
VRKEFELYLNREVKLRSGQRASRRWADPREQLVPVRLDGFVMRITSKVNAAVAGGDPSGMDRWG